jgi:hypothetical protein
MTNNYYQWAKMELNYYRNLIAKVLLNELEPIKIHFNLVIVQNRLFKLANSDAFDLTFPFDFHAVMFIRAFLCNFI